MIFYRINGVEAIHQCTTSHSWVWLQSLGSIYWDVLSVGFMWMRKADQWEVSTSGQCACSLHILSCHTMDSYFRALCMTFLVASFTRRSSATGPVIICEPCDVGARLLCKPLPKDCAEKVREPGCGCCLTCALSFGQPCGVYTGRCGSGLTCQHQPGETKPLQALLEGRGICVNGSNRRPTVRPTPPVNELPGNAPWVCMHLVRSFVRQTPRNTPQIHVHTVLSNYFRLTTNKCIWKLKTSSLLYYLHSIQLNGMWGWR